MEEEKKLKEDDRKREIVIREMEEKKKSRCCVKPKSIEKNEIMLRKIRKVKANVTKKQMTRHETSKREGFLIKRKSNLVKELILKRIEKKIFYSQTKSRELKEDIEDLKVRINVINIKLLKRNYGTRIVKGVKEQRVIYPAMINNFYKVDRKSKEGARLEEDRPILVRLGCPSCGKSRKIHNGFECGFIQQSQNYCKKIAQKCPKCGKNERIPYREFCDLCTDFVKCILCSKNTCIKGKSFCQNCFIFRNFDMNNRSI